MTTRLLSAWYRARYSFWALPTLMVIAASFLALGAERIDRSIGDGAEDAYWVYGGSADGARQMLATIAGSMITVAGLVFSITIATLTLASQQFGPRLLRNFMRDRGNQFVLGTFIATFLYCLLVLRQVRGGDDAYVPGVSIGIALALAVISLGVLIYFIHHVASSIQANTIIAAVARDLDAAVDRLFPQPIGHAAASNSMTDASLAERVDREGATVRAETSGYLEVVEDDALMRLACERDAIIWLYKRPGHYLVAESRIARVLPETRVDHEMCERVNGALLLAESRTVEQDLEFAVDQLVQVALRALSTGINDPFTAIVCIDRLTSSLVRLMGRDMPSPYRYDDQQHLRVIAPAITFGGVMDAAFNAIRQNGAKNVPVTIRLLESMTTLIDRAERQEHRDAILHHAEAIVRSGREHFEEPNDRADLEERLSRIKRQHGPVA